MAEFVDRILKCSECGAEFLFTAGEQRFYQEKNFRNEPKRCKACKDKREQGGRRRSAGGGGGGGQRMEISAVCSQCGKQTTLPFRPTQGRPVYCRECFQQRRLGAAGGEP
jgi:CxxC-x17-CxxC domain-containing protein